MDNKEYIYLKIPAEWICTYHKLLNYMADFGKIMIIDCDSTCSHNVKNIITCWNIFQSALAAKSLGKNKEANLFIEYINKQLALTYKGTNEDIYNEEVPIEIDENGYLIAGISCNNNTYFDIDIDTGTLYVKQSENSKTNYLIENDNLITIN